MNLEFVVDMYISVVLVACIVAGYVIKKWVKDVNNKWIPTLCCILGMILACVSINEITLETIVAGAVTGLASTGLHQAFTQLINGSRDK